MNLGRSNWLWIFFFIISAGLVLSYSFVGKFNLANKQQTRADSIILLWPEEDCAPLKAPCAAFAKDKALVLRPYAKGRGQKRQVRVHLRTLGLEAAKPLEPEAVWLDKSGSPLGQKVRLQQGKKDSFGADLPLQAQAEALRLSVLHQGHLLVADMPLSAKPKPVKSVQLEPE
ncbi:MAG: hypothetical protein HQL47_11945 [Gammaproteobacteria bacterium]|nr:hypothetical protein [Gammaproteobacteria bacterium]